MKDFLTLDGNVDDVSWQPPAGMTFERWQAEGSAFQKIGGAINWWLGDWLNEGERRYGETYSQAIEVTGHKLEQLTVCKYVASRVKRLMRVKNLSWTHHRYVAHLSDIEQADILHCADGLRLSSRETQIVAQLDRTARETLLRYAREHYMTSAGLMDAIRDYEANLAPPPMDEGPERQTEEVPFANTPDNPLYNAEQQADRWAGEADGYEWNEPPVAVSPNGQRRVIECLGLWEYAYTDEDGVAQYHLTGVTSSIEAAQMWLEYRNGAPVIRVKHINPLDVESGQTLAIERK